jgi:hypothetical protein
METKEYKKIDFITCDEDKNKTKIIYYYDCNESKKELTHEEYSECSSPQFICDFDEQPKDNTICYKKDKSGLYAIFFTNKTHFFSEQGAYDFSRSYPENPFKSNGYEELYDFILSSMKQTNGDFISEVSENYKESYLKAIEDFKSSEKFKEYKESFLKRIGDNLKFEEKRPIIKSFIDEYIKNNPKYTCVRIY